MLSPGRDHDLKLLEAKLREAKTVAEREKWKHKIRQILNESNNEGVMNARANLIEAYKSNDKERIKQAEQAAGEAGRHAGTSK